MFVSLACVVTMVTTYAMILPAITAVIEDMVGTEIAVTEEEELAEEIVEEEEEEILSEETLPEESLPEDTVLQENAGGVTVTAEFAQNVLPEDVSMMVEEVDASDYADMVASAVGDGYTIRKVLDITFLSEGVETEPDGEVRVTFQDPAICAMTDPDVVHISGDGSTEVMETMVTDDEIVFDATGFSAYAIVEGPQPVPVGWSKITTIDELFDKGSTTGLKIGHKDGYYFKNTLTSDNSGRVGITKTKPAEANPGDGAATYYFERVDGSDNQIYAYCYAADGTTKQYVYNGGNNSLSFTDEAHKTAFTVMQNSNGTFSFYNGSWFWNMQGSANGTRFCSYNQNNDDDDMNLWYQDAIESEPYGLDGKTYGLMNWNGGVAGKALMSTASSTGNKLDAKSMTVMSTADGSDTLFAPSDSEISMWTFHWISGDKYYLTSEVGGSTKYLRIDASGLSMVDLQEQASQVRVVPGTGNNKGEICLKSEGNTLTYTGSVAEGYSVNGSTGSEWLKLVELSELTKDYFMTYSARKVSVSDESVTNGTPVIVYTRSWNEERLKYDYYAISSDGSLVPVYECGDSIEWVSGQLNKLLWDFTEYYWEGTTNPNFYYDLYNQYSGKYIDPQVAENEVLSDEPIGINLNGRRDGKYYSTILAWDDEDYAFVGLKVENGKVVPCPKSEAMDFYFAEMQDLNVDDKMTTVETVDNNEFGIKMKMKNFPDRTTMSDFLGNNDGTANHNLHQGLLSTQLGANGYPTATKTGFSLEDMYNLNGAPQDVNHLFIQSTYEETGYFEYDSAQNFATLKKTNDGNFTVYNELGTYDSGGDKPTLKHGQFFPYNDLKPGTFALKNGQNLYDVHSNELPDSDPRKHEHLYSIEYDNVKADCYFGMELEASFTETHNGQDAWGHDIIFEFTGDDDFWMYVDGELIIDLGGIHSAVPGSVNFSTGDVNVNGEKTTLRALFAKNYKARNPDATDEEVADFLANYFEGDSRIFKENTTHTMKIFYMERGAGASNLHMRFNLASVKEGEVLLSKTLAGVDESGVLAEFPYQIFYKKGSDEEYRLQNGVVGADGQPVNYVLDQDSSHPVTYRPSVTIDGTLYQDVFFLKPDEVAEISFPEGMTTYRIVECGVDTQVYKGVSVNGQTVNGTPVVTSNHREDYGIGYDTTDGRPKVNYVNEVDPDALRKLTITKKLYKEDGITEILPGQDQTEFSFRLFMASEFDDLELANMHPYHVKDPQGNYCSWNIARQEFVKIGDGITDFNALTSEQKAAATFTTSIYGSISKIRAGYTVEVRDVLAGTKYRVEERPGEIPDGYTLKGSDVVYEQHEKVKEDNSGVLGVEGQVVP
ncbi:MAG: hypothetical protein IIY29_05395, partial [Firmicutes bacterium]|nr:hypothetical protein [Bacillota bacterium]